MTKVKQPDLSAVAAALKIAEPTILDELNGYLDQHRPHEFEELRKSIEEDGIREPIIIWKEKNVIVDGHTRFKISKLLEMPWKNVPRVEKSFKSISDVKQWMLRNQLGRRNLTKDRFEYYIGVLYNETRQDKSKARTDMGGEDTAKKIGKQFGVSDRTVRRAAQTASGVDMLERVKGKLAKVNQLDGKGDYTKQELAEVGKVKNANVAKKALEKLDKVKANEAAERKAQKTSPKTASKAPAKTEPDDKETSYEVVYIEPNFDAANFSASGVKKPNLTKNAIVYMLAADEHLGTAIELVTKWGLDYECSFVLNLPKAKVYEGVWSKVAHGFLIAATRGTVAGPKEGQELSSLGNEMSHAAITKLLATYHKTGKRLYIGNEKTPQGWSRLAK